MTTFGVIVPCRNEAAVIERKLRNLAACEWPERGAPHDLIVVDDGSSDGTAQHANRELIHFDALRVRVRVVANALRAGKGGAIESGLRELRPEVALVVLTDADVVVAHGALTAFARAFEAEPRLAMASGAQRFVVQVPEEGSPAAPRSDAALYDRFANAVRALESRLGLLFSVQGQWMAWRRELELHPTPNIAADDLDLMLQVRCKGGVIRRVAGAEFFEMRAPRGAERERQSVRRARAFVQFLRHPRIAELRTAGGWLARRQARAYLRAARPSAAWSVVPLLATGLAGLWWGPRAALAVISVLGALGAPLWVLLRIVRSRIEVAQSLEARQALGEAWETARR